MYSVLGADVVAIPAVKAFGTAPFVFDFGQRIPRQAAAGGGATLADGPADEEYLKKCRNA
jgi:hypothetical protein